MARAPVRGRRTIWALAVLAVAAPLLVLVAALGVRTGLWPVELGYDLLTLQVAWWLSFVGVGAGVLAVILALRDFRRLGLLALVALVIGAGTLGVFVWQKGRLAAGPVENVSTDLTEVPGFGDLRSDDGQGPAVGIEACPGARPAMTQIAPESAAWALQEAGFALRKTGVSRADGSRDTFWFGFTHDAVIRIRPGRTDIRVAARDDRPHGGEACRLVTRISEALNSR
ncbi:DUF1499 domain-containing protein [Brevundimonas lenta]|uniref:DUF1499 domain-containing protein n=1 Tax=Brevundimonas lenta TaxID=424796 RepID=A0A7W6JCP6_9CAUL|nr:DUF1499 domain-containing protein [Brevundimonas lenta]MBB4082694.1 hypothetical protein [Brevundimonas lenta]